MYNVKDIFKVYKNETIEKQYIIIKNKNKLEFHKISKNENEFSGELCFKNLYNFLSSNKGSEVLICHNHILTGPLPSFPDFDQYYFLNSIFNLFNIKIKDYLIVSKIGYFSFNENNLLNKAETENINTGNEILINHDFIFSKETIEDYLIKNIKKINSYTEIFITKNNIYFCNNHFDSEFIFKLFIEDENSNIVYIYNDSSVSKNRVENIEIFLKPLEIYKIKNKNFYSTYF